MKVRSVAGAALAATLALAAGVTPSYAHHSFAMFDQNTTTQLTGTLKDVAWNNPHTAMIVEVPGDNGQAAAEWHFESGPPAFMLRAGLKRDDLSSRIGSKVTVTFHPLKDGRTGGSLVGMKFEDGASWKL
jgi:hypothetical protein